MRTFPFMYCVILTSVLFALYIARHNRLTEMRIRAVSLERKIRVQKAQIERLELEISQFLSPVRLEEVAKKAQYAHLKQPSTTTIRMLDDL